jgi:hypothetical protein
MKYKKNQQMFSHEDKYLKMKWKQPKMMKAISEKNELCQKIRKNIKRWNCRNFKMIKSIFEKTIKSKIRRYRRFMKNIAGLNWNNNIILKSVAQKKAKISNNNQIFANQKAR